jgi:hypothetical protein
MIKHLTAAAISLSAMTVSAHANGVINCVIERHDRIGVTTAYTFIPAGKDVLAEYAYTLNSNTLVHAPEDRPLWSTKIEYGRFFATYRPDPRYYLSMDTGVKGPVTLAGLFKDNQVLGTGECRYQPANSRGFRLPGE